MLTGSYRKRLEADLIRWVGEGLVTAEAAGAIRRSVAAEGGFKLPGLLGLFGGLLIASSMAAFVAANWELIPRLLKLAAILIGVVAALGIAARLDSRGSRMGADAAASCGVLIFGAGIALIGQMYHLPADWPAGALLVALGALVVAALLRSNGALAIAFVALCAWSGGRWQESQGALHLAFFLVYLPALWLAWGRQNRLVHHLAVLALAFWLVMVPGDWVGRGFDYGLLAYGLAISASFVALGAMALDRGGLALLGCCLPWGLFGFVLMLDFELIRILDLYGSRAGRAFWANYAAYAAAFAAIAACAGLARDRRFAWPLALALVLGLVVPLVFWSGLATGLAGKVVVASLVLGSAIALVVAGVTGGVRRLTLAGSGMFGLAILILLWQTIGTLLDQSLFFLVAGALLLALAGAARRLFARLARPAGEAA
ncbi:DUF2157 domain-containing protein [Bosea sp. (in: a-proteobacteria)]|uniref:DUF2157 domain-containing protein n=1 Tax=Bosea sp. (in: a-proteobacteria) TaxID=1871050 RepID=UPI002734883D|nr:DUF2157 domain-containing protein [Bosea sp. (in: a-proteobacteria)]MDP3410948.1 DUF2157 domain-containing protein [Bosea sp. (in: a-proteobacteria)]